MTGSVGRKLVAAFAIATTALLGTGWLASQSIEQLLTRGKWSEHTQAVIAAVERLRLAYRALESDRRAFALTADAHYARSHDSLAGQITPLVEQLRWLTKDNALQQERIDTLEGRLDSARVFSSRVLILRKEQGLASAATLVAQGEGRQHMQRVDEIMTRLIQEEQRLAVVREQRVAHSASRASRVIAFSTALSVLLMAGFYAALVAELRRRARDRIALAQSNAALQDFLDSAHDLVHSVDPDGRFLYTNDAWTATLGYGDEELSTLTLFDIVQPSSQAAVRAAFASVLDGTPARELEFEVRARNGRVVSVSGNSNRRAIEGRPVEMRAILRDVTRQKAAERMKDEIVSVVSHELRTPLTSILGSLKLLASGRVASSPEQSARLLSLAISNADRLVRLVNDMLDMERIASGKMTLLRKPVPAEDIVQGAVDAMRSLLEEQDIACETRVAPIVINADADRVVQTLTNLIGNALKFSPKGSRLQVGVESDGAVARFVVRDQGRGIPADQLTTIFERFHQVDASDSRELGGTGLGLSICRSIVLAHGGAIWAESVEGSGTSIFFTIPNAERPVIA